MKKVLIIGGKSRSLIVFRGPLIRSMLARGYAIIACAGEPEKEVSLILQEWGVCFEPVALSRVGINPFHDIRTCWQLFIILLKYKPDIVFSYTIKPIILGGIAARLAQVAEVHSLITGLGYAFTQSGTFKNRIIGYLARGLYKLVLRYSDTIIFQNRDDLREFVALGLALKEKCTVVNGSGIDLAYYTAAASYKSCNDQLSTQTNQKKKISFLLVARLLWDKGIGEYVSAARIIKRQYPYVYFVLVGHLDDNPSSISKEELDLWIKDGVVEYMGGLEDVRPAYAACDVYVLPSYREGTPRTVLEAMANCRPIITTDAPGCRETIKRIKDRDPDSKIEVGQNGILVPTKDIDALVQSMEYLINNPQKIGKMGQESFKYVKDRYDVHNVNKAIMETIGL